MTSVQEIHTPPNTRPASRSRNLLRQIIVAGMLLLAFVGWRHLDRRGEPETVGIPPSAHYRQYKIHEGILFWRTGQDKLVVHCIPIAGGKERILVEDTAEFNSPGWEFGLMFGTRDLLYQSHKSSTASVFQSGITIPDMAQPAYQLSKPAFTAPPDITSTRANGTPPQEVPQRTGMGTVFLASPDAIHPSIQGEQRRKLPFIPPVQQRLRRVSLTGGVPQDVQDVEACWNTRVGGDFIYWLHIRPDEVTQVQKDRETWCEVTGHSELMLTSLTTGKSRQVASGLPANTYLHADENGVYWTLPHRHPDTSQTLYHLHPTDSVPNILPDFKGNLEAMPPVEFQGRLYWLVSDWPNILWRGDWLYSAKLDGSDQKVILARTQSGKLLRKPITVYRGSLYLFLQEDNVTQHIGKGNTLPPPLIALCRLHPERPNPIELIKDSVYGSNFDGDYIYFQRVVEHRSFRDYLVSDGMSVEEEHVLCRYPLK